MGLVEGFLWGLLGGCLAELLGWFKLRHQAPEQLPAWMGTFYYWMCTVLMIGAGGLLVIAYLRSEVKLNPITAINIGASAPLLLGSFISQTPPVPLGRID
jgi:hypothetical protein